MCNENWLESFSSRSIGIDVGRIVSGNRHHWHLVVATAGNSLPRCKGHWYKTRCLFIDSQNKRTSQTKQLVYALTDESTGVSEVLAVDAHRYLVIEHDSNAGNEAKFKHIYLADTQGATDVSSIASLARTQLPESV